MEILVVSTDEVMGRMGGGGVKENYQSYQQPQMTGK